MANLPPTLTIHTQHLPHGAIKLAKLKGATCFYTQNKGTQNLRRMNILGRNLFSEERGINMTRNSECYLELKVAAASQSSAYQTGPDLYTSTVEELENASTYLFRTETGGQVKVIVGRSNMKYVVYVEVSSLPQWSNEDMLVLNWGMFRSNSSSLLPMNPLISAPGTVSNTTQTPFMQESLGRKTNFCVPVGISSGYPAPLGISFSNDGSVNFAFFSRNTESIVLCLYDEMTDKPSSEIDLDPYVNRTGDVWHVSMGGVGPYKSYGYRCKADLLKDEGDRSQASHVLLDPYAKILKSSFPDHPGSVSLVNCLGGLCREPSFDWSGDTRLCLPMENLVVYRLNVAQFTEDKSSQLPTGVAGTFSGLTEKLHHFKALGVNAIMLEPIFPFDEQKGPYFPYNFFSPTNLYGPSRDSVSAINSMKEMVKNLHANNIEVLLEVVFTLTAEDGDSAPQPIGLHGIHKSSFYVVDDTVESRAKSSLNCNDPIIQRMVLDSLRHWVTEFHIDGFCFMNASALLRGLNGEHLSRPPLIEAIAFDPLLSKTKIIADCWDPCNVALEKIRFPHWKRWAEMNTKFCHDVRSFLRGEGLLSDLATRLCGSGDIFLDGRGPAFSFNFITRNFGLPLVDLVSFSAGELSSQLSWNCGVEGPTNKAVVLERRLKQIRNFLFILNISLGVPVLNMGDECGQSSNGSPSYSDRKSFDWDALRTGYGVQMTQYIAFLSSLRMRRSDLFQKRSFMLEESIDWIGSNQAQPRWEDPSSKFLAMMLKADGDAIKSSSESSDKRGDLFIVFNASDNSENVNLPPPSEGMAWVRLIDTALPFPGFFLTDGACVIEKMEGLAAYEIKSHSCALFESKSPNLEEMFGINSPDHPHTKEWLQSNAVFRVSLGNFLFFGSLALIMIGVKDQNDKRHAMHHGGWILKIVVWALLIILMFFLPDVIITIYETLSKFGSGLFLLVQVIILLDFTHTWNDAWVEKDEQKWYIALLAVSVGCYIAAFTFSGVLFIWFNPPGHDCGLNVFFIVMTMILAFGFAIIALHPQVNGSLLPASVISVYCSYVLYSALSSEPRDYVCNGLHNRSKGVSTGNLILGMLTTVLSVLYSACRAGSSTTFLSPPSSPKSGGRKPLLEPTELEEGKKDKETEATPVSYSYMFFHLIFALASMYSGMLLTGWTSSTSTGTELIDVGWTSVWVRICTQWVTAGLYVWSLVAPLLFPDREFF
ncbi:Glycoside hydrolase [Macleaya cordata]|uniref:Glycoside hydrolase n=1 Tax=Macleaya cordata TaxID=56857 RepID=A0A200RBI4_MACCD|nr:Glycoside hydrolase [Macleaya cordata]